MRARIPGRLPTLGPLVLVSILIGFLAALLAQYAHFAYGVGRRPEGSTLDNLLYRPDDAIWIQVRPELEQYQAGITTWPHAFGDLFDVWLHSFEGNPYTEFIFGPSLYPPLLLFLTKPWQLVSYGWVLALFLVACAVVWLWLGSRLLRRSRCPNPVIAAFIVLFFTLPLLFAMDRGNVEALVALTLPLALLGVVGTVWTRSDRPWPLVLAGFLKISPIALLGIVRWNRQTVIQSLVAGAVFGTASVVALFAMSGHPVDTARAYVDVVTGYSPGVAYIFDFRASIWGLVASWLTILRMDGSWAFTMAESGGLIGFAVMILSGVIAAVLPLHLWERVVLVATALVLWSGDGPLYRELYLVVGLLLLLAKCWNARQAYPTVMALLLVCVLAPKPSIPTLPWFFTLATGTPMLVIEVLVVAWGVSRFLRIRARHVDRGFIAPAQRSDTR